MSIFDYLKNMIQMSKDVNSVPMTANMPMSIEKNELKIRELKKQAAACKKEDINKAIALLQEAIDLEGNNADADIFIRLSKYLFKAGLPDKAWKILNDSIIKFSNKEDQFNCYISLMHIYNAMGDQLEKEKKFGEAFLNYLISGFLQKKADLEGLKNLKNNLKYFNGTIDSEGKEMVKDRKREYYEWNTFLLDYEDEEKNGQRLKEKDLLDKQVICKEILAYYGGWESMLNHLGRISPADFSRKAKEVIDKYQGFN